jgi:flagellar biosynthesis chaperone FliJ
MRIYTQMLIPALFITAKLGITKSSADEWIDYNIWISFYRILLNKKKEQTTETYNNMDEFQKHYDEWKKPNTN